MVVGQHQSPGSKPEPLGVAGQKRQQVKWIGHRAVGRQFHRAGAVVRVDTVVARGQHGVLDDNDRFESTGLQVPRGCRHPPRVAGDTATDRGEDREFRGALAPRS